jgi:hypothetical protein
MRFMVMHKVDATMEAGDPPPPGLVEQMGELVGESLKAGVFLNGAGLHRSALRVRLDFNDGKRTANRGPYTGKNELIQAFYMIKAKGIEQAIEQASRVASVLGDVEIEIGPVVEPWDLGFVKKPKDLPFERFLLLEKTSPRGDHAGRRAAKTQALSDLKRKMTDEGVLVASDELAPSSRSSRLLPSASGKRTWTDGPFAESKELIAGLSRISAPSKADALARGDRYVGILGEIEVDVCEVLEPTGATT